MNHRILSKLPQKTWVVHAVGGAIVLAVACVVYGGLHLPLAAKAAANACRIQQLRPLLKNSKTVSDEHRLLSERLKELQHTVRQTTSRMPVVVEPNKFVDQLSRLAAGRRLRIVQLTASPPDSHGDHIRVSVACRLTGSFASVCQWLAAVDQLPQISKVSRLDIETNVNFDEYPVEVTFQLYYRPPAHDK